MSRVLLLASAIVPGGYFAIHSGEVSTRDCLRSAASLALLVPEDAMLSLVVLKDTEENDAIRWSVTITSEVRAACLAMAKAEQADAIRSLHAREAA